MHERIISNDNIVQGEGRRFQIPEQARRSSFAGAKVQINQALDELVSLYYGDTRLEHAAPSQGDDTFRVANSCCYNTSVREPQPGLIGSCVPKKIRRLALRLNCRRIPSLPSPAAT
ncbi:MAG: hypothetical protein ACRD4C_00710 [Candidatus Acidiferrales bacterium]